MVSDQAKPAPRYEAVPGALWIIAAVALAPFPAAALAYGWGPPDVARPALTVIINWSAVVLAFLGGARWGLETATPTPRWTRMLISVVSPVIAWSMLLSRHRIADSWIIGGCIAAFIFQWMFDHHAPDVPARYPKLSTALTGAACISLAICLDQSLKASHIIETVAIN
jgi:hypothetical protein